VTGEVKAAVEAEVKAAVEVEVEASRPRYYSQ
jgi:hypothetical protein